MENDLAQYIKGPPIVSDGPPKRPGPPIERRSWKTPPMIIRLKIFRSPHYNRGGLKPCVLLTQNPEKDHSSPLPLSMFMYANVRLWNDQKDVSNGVEVTSGF